MSEEAVRDLKGRTLNQIPNALGRIIYLASLRDYATGQYYHAGLSDRFGDPAAATAMERCHKELFGELALRSVEEVYDELVSYLDRTSHKSEEVASVWLRLRLFGILAPVKCNPILQEMFASHLKCVLRVLRCRTAPPGQGGSLPASPPR